MDQFSTDARHVLKAVISEMTEYENMAIQATKEHTNIYQLFQASLFYDLHSLVRFRD